MSFKRRLKEEISYQDIRLKELAAQANLSLRTLESYVDANERMPAADVAVRLAQALGVTVEYLVTGSDSFGKLREEFLPYQKLQYETQATIQIELGEVRTTVCGDDRPGT